MSERPACQLLPPPPAEGGLGAAPSPAAPPTPPPGIKNADETELIRVASTPTDFFFYYVGDFKLLGTLVPLMTRRVCTSSGGTLRTLGTGPPASSSSSFLGWGCWRAALGAADVVLH